MGGGGSKTKVEPISIDNKPSDNKDEKTQLVEKNDHGR